MMNYYEILGCKRDASIEQLRKGYHEGAKKFHPDKSSEETREDFDKLQKAWKTLSNPNERKEYDKELARNEFDGMPLYAEVELNEMTTEENGLRYTYSCRCGGVYALDRCDLMNVEEVRIGCDDCTFYLRIRVPGGRTS